MMDLQPHGPDTFVGIGPRYPWGGLYGGQIVAQALRAAGLSVESDHLPHSLHAYFIRPGDHTEPIRFEVDRIRNGRSFTTRRVVARQSIGAIFNMAASFQRLEEALDVTPVNAPDVAAPESIEDTSWSHVFDKRQLDNPWSPEASGATSAWLRMREPVAPDALTQACAIAYLSDDLPTEAIVAEHPDRLGLTSEEDFGKTFISASLDHAIWFHRPIDPSDWSLFTMRSRGQVGSRGLSTGEVFDASGLHTATVTQEVLLRRRSR